MKDYRYTREINHQTQPTTKSCVIACVCMLTGHNVKEMVGQSPERMLSHHEMLALLCAGGIFCIPRPSDRFYVEGVYLVGVPSLTTPGYMHCIIIDGRKATKTKNDQDVVVLDPGQGRNIPHYTTQMFIDGELSYTEILEVYDAAA